MSEAGDKKVRLQVMVEPALFDKVALVAGMSGMSRSALLAVVIESAFRDPGFLSRALSERIERAIQGGLEHELRLDELDAQEEMRDDEVEQAPEEEPWADVFAEAGRRGGGAARGAVLWAGRDSRGADDRAPVSRVSEGTFGRSPRM